ncbi:MAG: transcriptional repressor [Patescibacteria group bacterium]|nr:transcriptional repressor [Patescibacteria group bacterium]MDE1940941.1 transcriptional repressor [Patescibacteria group bacterium]MDE1966925.1 transcriptional repressor [Patescibacteria group bacterium]
MPKINDDFEDHLLEGPDAEFRVELWSCHLKASSRRIELLKALNDDASPYSLAEITEKLKEKCSRAMIYRSVDKLVECGLVRQLNLGRKKPAYQIAHKIRIDTWS